MLEQTKMTYENGIFYLSGELSFSNVDSCYQDSLANFITSPELIFDFANLTSVNSAGLALIFAWIKFAKKNNKAIQFRNLPSHLFAISKAAGIEKLIPQA
jgi:phospholipid transport system transporter-binding protein